MAYSQTKQLSDIEKRMGKVRAQLYGKAPETKLTFAAGSPAQPALSVSEQSLIYKDLAKTIIIASVVIAIQFVVLNIIH